LPLVGPTGEDAESKIKTAKRLSVLILFKKN